MPVAARAQATQVITLSNQYSAPQYVTVNADKTVVVSDTTYALSGLFLVNGAYTTTPVALTSTAGFSSPEGVAVDQGGDILAVTNFTAQNIGIWEFRPPDYANIYAQSLNVTSNVQGAAFDSHGSFFFANSSSSVLEIPAPNYAFAISIAIGQSGIDHPFGIAFDSHDNLFVADQLSGSGQILQLTAASGYATVTTITSGNLQQPVGVAVDTRGNLYVTDSARNTLTEILAPNYTVAAVIDSTHFSSPGGVALDADDNIFVVDTGNNALKEIPAQPAVTGLAPVAGPNAGGNTVTITGVHLTGATAVKFGSVLASSFTVVSDTQVTATAPAGSGTVDVLVTTPNGTSVTAPTDKYTYTSFPVVSSISPKSGPAAGGNTVTIAGGNLSNASAVSFGGTPATSFSVVNAMQISAVAPPGAVGTVDVTVTTVGGTSAPNVLDQYTYVAGPTVSVISPSSGLSAGGTAVTITGTNFTGVDFTSFDVAVHFGSALSPVVGVVSGTEIIAEAPAAGAPGTVDVTVTTPNGTSATSAADAFTYVAAPTVTAVSPTSGPAAGGTVVTITGANLSGATAVTFGTSAAAWFNVMSATSITAKAPPGSGTVDVTVTNTLGTTATSPADQFSYVAPATRTFVSASSGSDSNTCARTAPCLTFAAALNNTTAGGEIDVLDPGDFGPVTLTGSITIDGGGPVAAVGDAAGTSGITVNASATDVINLRGLTFNGYGESGASGIVFNSGSRLQIENCSFQGFDTAGITFTPGIGSATTAQMFVEQSTIVGNGGGVLVKPTAGIAAAVTLVAVHIDQNSGSGLIADGTGGSSSIHVAIADSSANSNASSGIAVTSAQASVKVDAIRVTIAANGLAGIQSQGGAASVTVGSSQISGNATGLQPIGGVLVSYGNNQVTGNGSNGSFTTGSLQ